MNPFFREFNRLFNKSIPTIYNGVETISVYLSAEEISTFELFKAKIVDNLSKDIQYTSYVKLRYDSNHFFMVGPQTGFFYKDESSILNLFNMIQFSINDTYNNYNISTDDIVYIQVSFMKLSEKLLSEFRLDDNNGVRPNIINNEHLNIPISINEDSLKKPLTTECDNEGNLTAILYNNGEEIINLLTLINENAKFSRTSLTLDKHYKFYSLTYNISYILAVKIIDSDHIHKIRFTCDGSYISQVHDRVIGDSIFRSSNNKTSEIKNNEVIQIEQKLQLKPIKKPVNKISYISNPNIGVIDTETYLDSNGLQKVYSLGFKTNLEDNPITFYLDDKGLDSNYLITLLIDELLKPKYNGHTFYCHNLGVLSGKTYIN